MPDLQDKLREDVADVEWKDLLPHAKRDAIIVVTEKLHLPEVGAAIAQDNTTSVQEWISNQSISKPSSEQLTNWNNQPQKQFIALIVQPFVIIKEA
jgi:hypothetical protein